jgi:putative ABC transport system permease protein
MVAMANVPVGRRNLFSERRRAFLGIAGVAASLFMVLALDGIFGGLMRQVTGYIDFSGADVVVSQRGVRTMHMSSSTVPLTAAGTIRALPGVRWADPILYDTGALLASGNRELTYLIGFTPNGRGGPASIVAGTEPGPGEIVIDRDAADSLGVGLGGRVRILDRSWRVSGMTAGMTNFVNSVSYVRFDDFARARGLRGVGSYVLVGTRVPVSPMVDRIEKATGLTAQSRSAFASEERRGVKDMTTDLMQIMTIAAFMIGLAVIGLSLYTATLSRLREIGVMKALGARPGRLGRIVASQAAWTVGSAVAIAVLLAMGLGWVLGRETSLPLVVEWPSVLRAAAGGAILGSLGALAPLLRVWRVDPASVFRR